MPRFRDPADLRILRVGEVVERAERVVSMRLRDQNWAELPEWAPGAHLEVVLPSGRVRHYSLHGDPADRAAYEIAVLREDSGGGGSLELHELATAGAELTVRGPRNHFPLVEAAHHLLVAGGIGVTPILAMARELARRDASWSVVYGGRSLNSMAFTRELLALDAGRVTLVPKDRSGHIDMAAVLKGCPAGTVVYCCGPAPLLDAVALACTDDPHVCSLQVERFSVSPTPGPEAPSTTFEVELRSTGMSLTVGLQESILERVLDVVPDWPWSCREGYCGTCETRVLEGEPEHRDVVLSDEEREDGATMMICVGRSRSPRLVLDI